MKCVLISKRYKNKRPTHLETSYHYYISSNSFVLLCFTNIVALNISDYSIQTLCDVTILKLFPLKAKTHIGEKQQIVFAQTWLLL